MCSCSSCHPSTPLEFIFERFNLFIQLKIIDWGWKIEMCISFAVTQLLYTVYAVCSLKRSRFSLMLVTSFLFKMKHLQYKQSFFSPHFLPQDMSILVFNQIFQMNGVLFSYKYLPMLQLIYLWKKKYQLLLDWFDNYLAFHWSDHFANILW